MAAKEQQQIVSELVKGLDDLRLAFDLYFQGLERVPPVDQRTKYVSTLRKAKENPNVRNTAMKFRINQLWAKYQTYDQMWNRILKEIEEGTYKRDRFKVKLRKKEWEEQDGVEQQQPKEDVYEVDDLDFDVEEVAEEAPRPARHPNEPKVPAQRPMAPGPAAARAAGAPVPTNSDPRLRPVGAPAAPGAPRPAGFVMPPASNPSARPAGIPGAVPRAPGAPVAPGAPRPPGAPVAVRPGAPAAAAGAPRAAGNPGGALSDDYVRKIASALSEAKKRVGDKSEVSFDALKQQLNKQVPAIKQQHNAKAVEFKVVIKDGKAILKAVPKT